MSFSVVRYFAACSLFTTCLLSTAIAAPPAECVSKHAGRWQITVRATGQTYPADLFPNGTGVSHCPMCSPGTWTCSGNTSTVFVNGITVVTTLSPDGRTGTSGCCISRRIGAAPAAASPPKQNAEKSPAPPVPAKPTAHKSSCSDITGTPNAGPRPTNCAPQKSAQKQNQKASKSPPVPPERRIEVPLPGVLSLLITPTAQAANDTLSDNDWDETFKKIRFSPTAFSRANVAARYLRSYTRTCERGFEVCKTDCDDDVTTCNERGAATPGMADDAKSACTSYSTSLCQSKCGDELTACSKRKAEGYTPPEEFR